MKQFIKVTVLTLATGLTASLSMAAPYHSPAPQYNAHPHMQQHNNQRINWQPGYKVPSQYSSQNNYVDHHRYKNLSKPGRNQQWVKVKGDYVLMDTRTHRVIRVVHA